MPDANALTPAEMLVLLDPARRHGRETVKIALLGLIARGVLRLDVQDTRGLRHRQSVALRLAAMSPGYLSAAEISLLDLIRELDGAGGRIAEIVKRARRRYGANFSRFERDYVRAALRRRGLIFETRRPVLWIFSRRRDERTAKGDVERRRIREQMAQALTIPDLLRREPAEAAALAASLGGTILLVPELRSHYQRLTEAMRGRGGEVEDGPEAEVDLGDLVGLLDDAIGEIDAALDAFDASFDASADGGNGGNGGNGGGNGGC